MLDADGRCVLAFGGSGSSWCLQFSGIFCAQRSPVFLYLPEFLSKLVVANLTRLLLVEEFYCHAAQSGQLVDGGSLLISVHGFLFR